MKYVSIFLLVLGCIVNLGAQVSFNHGVASGDPLQDAVIIWTRVTPEDPYINYNVKWKISQDSLFNTIEQKGEFIASPAKDFTVKVDVKELKPGKYYYYKFDCGEQTSIIGRTKTAAIGDLSNIKLAVVSCSNFSHGYFNGYSAITENYEVDAVLHLGDYIYEYGGSSAVGRDFDPPYRIKSVQDFRTRYAQYRTDEDLMLLHQKYPMIHIWDDHETHNNSHETGTESGIGGSEYDDLKHAATQVYFEWMPTREQESGQIYRQFSFGNLIDLFMLDTRLEARDGQLGFFKSGSRKKGRSLLGEKQMNWLKWNLTESKAQWKVIGNQVMFAQLRLMWMTLNQDQWDGYAKERVEILKHVKQNEIDNVVVLTGDFHSSWVANLMYNSLGVRLAQRKKSLGVEFVVPAISSKPVGSYDRAKNIPFSVLDANNKHIQYRDLIHNGFVIFNCTKEEVEASYYFLETTQERNTNHYLGARYISKDGENFVRKGF